MSTPALIGIAIVSLIVAGCAVFLWARYIFSAPFAEDDELARRMVEGGE